MNLCPTIPVAPSIPAFNFTITYPSFLLRPTRKPSTKSPPDPYLKHCTFLSLYRVHLSVCGNLLLYISHFQIKCKYFFYFFICFLSQSRLTPTRCCRTLREQALSVSVRSAHNLEASFHCWHSLIAQKVPAGTSVPVGTYNINQNKNLFHFHYVPGRFPDTGSHMLLSFQTGDLPALYNSFYNNHFRRLGYNGCKACCS